MSNEITLETARYQDADDETKAIVDITHKKFQAATQEINAIFNLGLFTLQMCSQSPTGHEHVSAIKMRNLLLLKALLQVKGYTKLTIQMQNNELPLVFGMQKLSETIARDVAEYHSEDQTITVLRDSLQHLLSDAQ